MSDQKDFLLNLNALMLGFKTTPVLSKLPSGSWLASALLEEELLTFEILRNDRYLKEKNLYSVSDPTDWLLMFIPAISKFLSLKHSVLPPKLRVIVSAKSEFDEWRINCFATDLINLIENRKSIDWNTMMEMLEPELVKNE